MQIRNGRATVIGSLPKVRPVPHSGRSHGDAHSPGVIFMSAATLAPADIRPVPIPLDQALPWAIFVGLILMLAIYFVGAEQGATSIVKGMYVHEFVHDGRHLLGFPCH